LGQKGGETINGKIYMLGKVTVPTFNFTAFGSLYRGMPKGVWQVSYLAETTTAHRSSET